MPDPAAGLTGFQPAVELARQRIHDNEVTTSWSSAATAGAPSDPLPTDPDWAGGCLLDRLCGGPGLRRGRRDPFDLSVGDALDWWRVEEIEDNHLLRLRAEMRLPGLAWLELIIDTTPGAGPRSGSGRFSILGAWRGTSTGR